MWLYNKFKINIVILTSLIVSNCVVTPLYAPDKPIVNILKTIHIKAPTTRFEQIITNKLAFNLYGGEKSLNQKYNLKISGNYYYRYNNLSYKQDTIQQRDLYSMAGDVYASVNYVLTDNNGKIIQQGELSTSAPYTRLTQGYANLQAEQDARSQAAIDLAEQLTLKLIYLANRDSTTNH